MKALAESLATRRARTYVLLGAALLVSFFLLRTSSWQGSTELHTLMETVASLLALMVGALAMVRFYTKKNNTFLFIGTGFLGTALLDGYHATVTSSFFASNFPSAPASLIPWSWVASRWSLSVLLALSWLAWTREQKKGPAGIIGERAVYSTVGFLTVGSFLFFALVPLPRAYYPEIFFHRPEEFVPASFFLLALVGYLRKGHWKHDDFEYWLVLALIVSFVGQAVFMSLSDRLFDLEFDVAHTLKKVSYIFVLTGLLISIYNLFKKEERQNRELAEEIQERQRAEEAVRRANLALEDLNQTLEDRVQQRTQELEEAQDQMVRTEKLAAIGQLAGSVAHDLRSPLGAINNAVYYLRRRLGSSELAQANPKIGQFLGIIDDEVRHSNQIITDLMDFARGKPPTTASTNLAEVVEKTLSALMFREDIHIETRFESEMPEVLGDSQLLNRVFANLAINALDAMPEGGQLTITGRRVDGFAELSFGDTGVGIEEQDLKRLFDPLFTTKIKGTGLGLSICHEIVSQHNGAMDVASTPGEGSTFTIRLPVDAGSEAT